MNEFSEEEAKQELEKRYSKAKDIIEDEDKTEKFLQRLENKLKMIPAAGNTLAMIPTLISLVRSYSKKEYKDVPIGTIIAIVSALIYWLSPIDAIPDIIPGLGYVDDVAVLGVCLKLVKSDLDEYQKWRKENNKILN